MLHPIAYVSAMYCGPSLVDVETAVEAYADKLAGRRRRMDISMTSLSVATMRDVDDGARAITAAAQRWLVDAPTACAAAEEAAAAGPSGPASSDDATDDDDDLIITTDAAPRTNTIKRSRASIPRAHTFIDLFLRAKSIKAPSLPSWEDLMVASGGTLAAAVTDSVNADDNDYAKDDMPRRVVSFDWESVDLSNPLDQELLDRLGVERFDEEGCPRTATHVSGMPSIKQDEACPWVKGAMDGLPPLVAPSSSPLRAAFPHLVSLDLSYTRVTSMAVFEGCTTIKNLRLVNNLGITAVPKGLAGLVTFEAERCFALRDIYSGLSGLPLLELISIDEAFKVDRLPVRLPALVQLNISRTDGLVYAGDVSGETFADPMNYPALEELFMHGQRTIRRLCPPNRLASHNSGGGADGSDVASSSPPRYILPRLEMLVASESSLESVEDCLSFHPKLRHLVLGPLCAALPTGLDAIKEVTIAGCGRITSLQPLVGSYTLEVLDISNTDALLDLVDGEGEEAYESEEDEDIPGGLHGEDAAAARLTSKLAAVVESKGDAEDDGGGGQQKIKEGEPTPPTKSKAADVPADVPIAGDPSSSGPAALYPAFPALTTFTAVGASIRSLRPLQNSPYLEAIDMSYTKHIPTLPTGLDGLVSLNTSYSGIRSLDVLEGSNTLTTLFIAYADRLKVLPQMPAIERINDHKANFFLKMYVVSNLQLRGVRLFLRQERMAAAANAEGYHHDPMSGI